MSDERKPVAAIVPEPYINAVVVSCAAGRGVRYHIKPGLHHCNVHFTHEDRSASCPDRIPNTKRKKKCECEEDEVSFCCDCENLLFRDVNTEEVP